MPTLRPMTHTPTTPGALHGQVAFITGAGSGLGAAFARRLARDGATIVINDLSPNAAAEVAAEVGGETAIFDVCDSVAFDAEIDKAVARYGRIDILVNNAGIAPPTDTDRVQQAIAKIVEGRLGGFFKQVVLLEQESITESKKSVKAVLDDAGVSIQRFARFEVGA